MFLEKSRGCIAAHFLGKPRKGLIPQKGEAARNKLYTELSTGFVDSAVYRHDSRCLAESELPSVSEFVRGSRG